MSRHWSIGIAVAVTLVLLGSEADPAPRSTIEPATSDRVARAAARSGTVDTVRTSTTTGTPVVLALPARLNDRAVTRYQILKAPALSGVVDRSFTWIPTGTPPGTYGARLHAHHSDGRPDTLVVQIRLEQ